jgi:HlyD family secretion protein
MKRSRIIILLLVGAAVAFYIYRARRNGEAARDVASGTVEATDAALGFQIPGRIARIIPREGDAVRVGDTLAILDRTELDARRAQAVSAINAARAQLHDIEAGARAEEIAQAREVLRAATDRLSDARRDFERVQRLFQGGAVSREALDKAQLAVEIATAQRNQADQQVRLLEAGPRETRVAAQRAAVTQSEAALRQVDALLANAVVIAPFDGVVTVRDREPGETVAAGAPVITIVNLNDRWIRIFVREDQLGAVHVGQDADITSDTYPGKRYRGVVSFIANQAEFTPRNVQTAEERVKLVFAVKVRIVDDPNNELKPGMPADVHLHDLAADTAARAQ